MKGKFVQYVTVKGGLNMGIVEDKVRFLCSESKQVIDGYVILDTTNKINVVSCIRIKKVITSEESVQLKSIQSHDYPKTVQSIKDDAKNSDIFDPNIHDDLPF